ncbi:MAG: O-antigen polysaccharide polymerase Wzy family protein, partial [Lachnospiraceae bacterium]|nr:O-antigen polysaccharide polymerase Wzy family protein [Lachnospiraceae bacterium]
LGQILFTDVAKISLFQPAFILDFTDDVKKHIYVTLYISLISVYIGYRLWEKKNQISNVVFDMNTDYVKILRNLSEKAMYFFFFFALLENGEKMVFVQQVSYIEYYTDFHSSLPTLFLKFANFYDISFYLYIATLPPKKEAMKSLLCFFIIGCISIGYGQRNGFVLNMLIAIIYIFFRDYNRFYGSDEKWLSRKMVIGMLCILPLLLMFLFAFSSWRSDNEVDSKLTAVDMLYGFFYGQGGSYRIIGYDSIYGGQFPSSFPYSLGYFVDMYEQNYLFKFLGIAPSYAPHTAEAALNGHNYGEIISYFAIPEEYLNGAGVGSCYIAEIYHDFGYVGVVLINMLYGAIFASFNRHSLKSVWRLFIFFCIIMNILYAPRASALYFITNIISVSFLGYVILMRMIVNNKIRKTHKR